MLFLASKFFDSSRASSEERLQREVAYQWWGQSVGLKTFDDAWVSQGLAEWSAFALRESKLAGAQLDATQREKFRSQEKHARRSEEHTSELQSPHHLVYLLFL